jgi:hypothetical protein
MWGLAVDNIVSMDVVLANGHLVKASKKVNPDLFWVSLLSSSPQPLLRFIGDAWFWEFVWDSYLH